MFNIDSKHKQWLQSSSALYNRTENRTQRCQSLLLDIQKTIDCYESAVVNARNETEHRLRVNIGDIQHRIKEILRVKAMLETEMDNLSQYKQRVSDYRSFLDSTAIQIVRKCVLIRQSRQCVDLHGDAVDKALTREHAMLEDIISLTSRLEQQASEHTRHLKQLVFALSADLSDKDASVNVDISNADLKQESLLLSLDTRKLPLCSRKYSHEENTEATKVTLRESNLQLVNCRHFRSMVDFVLRQTVEHLTQQKDNTDEMFRRKIEDYQEAKAKLENQHCETIRSLCDMNNTIADLEKAIEDKRGYIMLAHSRLANRSARPGVELVRDDVDARLEKEIKQLRTYTAHLHFMRAEARGTSRNLAKLQSELEENINIKSNSLKLDQVDCSVLRLGLSYNVY